MKKLLDVNEIKICSQLSTLGTVPNYQLLPTFLRLGVQFEILNKSPKTNKKS